MAQPALQGDQRVNQLRSFRIRPTAVALAVAACFNGTALANPTAPTVVNGSASFAQAGNILNITNSPNAIINWGSFSIGVNELTRFIQQSGSSAVLNRVIGQDPSAILGALQSNGRVFLVNPNGIVFGAGAQINVAGLVASTLNLSNDDFLNNRMKFTDGAGAGNVVNQGNITGGSVYLIGKAVTNDGLITSPNGEVLLAAGNSVELVSPGTPNLRVEIVAADNEAKNLGAITAEAGRIGIYAGLISNSGTLNASSAVAEGGRILLKSTKSTTLESSSAISASGTRGGEIIVLSDMNDGATRVGGTLDASGATGNGGFVETSAARVKISDGTRVTTRGAADAEAGKWLIDPNDYFISAAYGGDITGATLSANLNLGNVEIQSASGATAGSGDIFVDDAVSWNSAFGLTLLASRNVVVNQSVSNAGSGSVRMYAGWNGVSSVMPAVSFGVGNVQLNALTSTAGDMYLIAGNHVIQNGSGVVFANNLLADGGYTGVTLDQANNRVNTLAGRGGQFFKFLNDKSLTVGSVAGVAGINVTNGGDYTNAVVEVTVTDPSVAGNLTVNNNIIAQAGPGGQANVTLAANGSYGGAITVNNSAVSAIGGDSVSFYGGSSGGNAYVQMTAVDGLTINNSSVLALAGHSTASFYGGGSGNVNLSAMAIDIKSGSVVRSRGGNGPSDGSGDGGDGDINIAASGANGVKIYSSLVEALGGSGLTGSQQGNGDINISISDPAANIDINNSTILANGWLGDIYFNAGSGSSIMLTNSSVTAQGRLGADGGEGYVSLYAPSGSINSASSSVGAFGQPGYGSAVEFYSGGDIVLGLVSSTDNVYVTSNSGAIVDGNAGLNVNSPYASLYGWTGVGSLANPLETQVSRLYVRANNGAIGIINSGDLALDKLYAGNGNSALGTTGSLTVIEGGEGAYVNNGNLALLANGDLNFNQYANASGNLVLNAGGNLNVGGPQAYYYGVSVGGDMSTTAVAGGAVNVLPGSSGGSSSLGSLTGVTSVVAGGNVLVDQGKILGSPDVFIKTGGVININGTTGYGGEIRAGSPTTIYLTFTNLTSGGFFINGAEGIVFDPATNTGFFAGGGPAILGTNLMITYGGVTSSISPPTNDLIVALGQTGKAPDAEKDKDIFDDAKKTKDKEAPVCR